MKRAVRIYKSTIALCVGATLLLAGLAYWLERNSILAEELRRLDSQAETIQTRLQMANAELQAAAAFISQANPAVSSLDEFTRDLPLSETGRIAWIWAKLATPSDIAQLESEVRREQNNPDFVIPQPQGKSVLAPVVMTFGTDEVVRPGQDLSMIPEVAAQLEGPGVLNRGIAPHFVVSHSAEQLGAGRLYIGIRLPAGESQSLRSSRVSILLRGTDLSTLTNVAALDQSQALSIFDQTAAPPRLVLSSQHTTDEPVGPVSREVDLGDIHLGLAISPTTQLPWPRIWLLILGGGILTTGLYVTLKAGELIRGEANSIGAQLSDTQLELSSIRRKEISFFENSGTANCETDYTTGKLIRVNDAMCEILGYSRMELIGRTFVSITHPDDVAVSKAALKNDSGGPLDRTQFEKRYIRKDGTIMWAMVNAKLHFGKHGEPEAYSSVILDISARKNDEETKAMLLRELAHRVRNTVQLTSSLARQTARTARSVKDYDSKFHLRLAALSGAQDILFDTGWKAASLVQIAERTMKPFLPDESSRETISLNIPELDLPAQQAQTIALALHELAGNSAQFGALAHGGTISLIGTLKEVDSSSRRRLVLHWEERISKRIRKPRKSGFGTIMLENALPEQFGGTATLTYRSNAVIYEAQLMID